MIILKNKNNTKEIDNKNCFDNLIVFIWFLTKSKPSQIHPELMGSDFLLNDDPSETLDKIESIIKISYSINKEIVFINTEDLILEVHEFELNTMEILRTKKPFYLERPKTIRLETKKYKKELEEIADFLRESSDDKNYEVEYLQ